MDESASPMTRSHLRPRAPAPAPSPLPPSPVAHVHRIHLIHLFPQYYSLTLALLAPCELSRLPSSPCAHRNRSGSVDYVRARQRKQASWPDSTCQTCFVPSGRRTGVCRVYMVVPFASPVPGHASRDGGCDDVLESQGCSKKPGRVGITCTTSVGLCFPSTIL